MRVYGCVTWTVEAGGVPLQGTLASPPHAIGRQAVGGIAAARTYRHEHTRTPTHMHTWTSTQRRGDTRTHVPIRVCMHTPTRAQTHAHTKLGSCKRRSGTGCVLERRARWLPSLPCSRTMRTLPRVQASRCVGLRVCWCICVCERDVHMGVNVKRQVDGLAKSVLAVAHLSGAGDTGSRRQRRQRHRAEQ